MALPALPWLAVLIVVVMQALLFATGYRLSADDVALHHIVLRGVGEVVEYTLTIAPKPGGR